MINAAYSVAPRLPWETDPQQEKRFKLILIIALFLTIAFCLLTFVVDVPEKTRGQAETIPPRLAKFIKDKKLIPPPPPPPPKIKEKLEDPKPVEKPKIEEKPKPKPKVKPIAKKKPLTNTEKAARKVAKKHISEFSSILSELSEFKPLPNASKRLNKGGGKAAKTDRSLITSRTSSKSSGVSVGRASQTVASVSSELIAQETTIVESSIANIEASASEHSSQHGKRTREEIQRVFDRNKSSIYALYNRALRKDPGLEGTVVFHIVVEPDGQISLCEIVSSELEDEVLNRKIIAKIRMFNFGSNQVETWDDTFYMDFIPS
ncbi:MAG: hypothetical protein COB51_02120 [Moraxellaceae bacterium]|nr:MAG: hypothetical protein COB51_02120 [Moraxellaceae bacterium]